MTIPLSGAQCVSMKDWAASAGFHLVLVIGAGWFLSDGLLEPPEVRPLDLSVSWIADAAPAQEPAMPKTASPPPPAPPQKTVQRRAAQTPLMPSAPSIPSSPVAADVVVPASPAAPETPVPEARPGPAAPSVNEAPVARSSSEQPRWQNQLEAMLAKHKRYPRVGQRMRQEGTVTVEAHFSPAGEVVRCLVVGTSGFKSLDEAAMQLVHQAADVARTQHQPGRATELRIPIVYELKES